MATMAAVALSLTVSGSAAAPATVAEQDVLLRFDAATGHRFSTVPVSGSAGARASAVSHAGGVVMAAHGQSGQGAVADFPAAARGSRAPAAVVAVHGPSGTDVLAPGSRSFTFGADFKLDPEDTGVDGGDNLVQRGLADDAGQYKLELDGQRPTCVVKGSLGKVTVRSAIRVNRGVWYRVQCRRDGNAVRIILHRVGGSTTTTTARGATGFVRTKRASTPLSVGGKLTPAGAVATWSTDQFNGLVDNAFLRID